VTVLQDMGIFVLTQQDANTMSAATTRSSGCGVYERHLQDGSPCFLVSDRFCRGLARQPAQERSLLVDGLEAGYVWDALSTGALRVAEHPSAQEGRHVRPSANTCGVRLAAVGACGAGHARGRFYTTPSGSAAAREQERAEARALNSPKSITIPDEALVADAGRYFRSFRGARRSRDSCRVEDIERWLKTTA